jgi:3-phosphoshikimate 1-carboxyvinyltransferase
MRVRLEHKSSYIQGELEITGSKSESNRLLILQALYPKIEIENLSNSDDTEVTNHALNSSDSIVNIHHAGTAMRFLTAYFSIQPDREIILTGSKRMQERPIRLLVDALKDLGAEISYDKKDGYPPLRIRGKKISKSNVTLPANISSQYVSALMLIATSLEKGLTIDLVGEMTSVPYIRMTKTILDQLGFDTSYKNNQIQIASATSIEPKIWTVESDWSSASYFYSIIALCKGGHINLSRFKKESNQGDSALSEIYNSLGVVTSFHKGMIKLSKVEDFNITKLINLDLRNTPDLAQTIAVSCLGLGIACKLSGLHTLKIKETDRLSALKIEIEKLGAKVDITSNSLELYPSPHLKNNIAINTYNDHRMAMAFAPLALKVPIIINDSQVVSKSYPTFWDDLKSIDFIKEII